MSKRPYLSEPRDRSRTADAKRATVARRAARAAKRSIVSAK